MHKKWIAVLALALIISLASMARADDISTPSGPVLSTNVTLPAVTIGLIALLFVAAMVVGPIIHADLPQETPLAAHDEPPGSSHHHGATGTINKPEPEDEIDPHPHHH